MAAGQRWCYEPHPADAGNRNGLATLGSKESRFYEQNKRKRRGPDPGPDLALGAVGHGRLTHVPLADRNLVEPELPSHVASPGWSGSWSECGRQFSDVRLYAAGRGRRRAQQLYDDGLTGDLLQ